MLLLRKKIRTNTRALSNQCPENPLGEFLPSNLRLGKLPLVNYHLAKFHPSKLPPPPPTPHPGEFPPGSGLGLGVGLGLELGNLTRWEFTGGQFTRQEFGQVLIHHGITYQGEFDRGELTRWEFS